MERLNRLNIWNSYFISAALPDLKNPFLRFFVLRAHAGFGVGEGVLLAGLALLIGDHFTKGHVGAQRGAVDIGNHRVRERLAFLGQEPVDEQFRGVRMGRVGKC